MIEIARYIVSGLLLALVQTFILQEVNIAWWIKPMPYILLFLNLPISANKFGVLIGAFFFGMTIDAFAGSLGMHTAACVTLVYVKHHIDAYFLDENSMQLQGLSYMHEDYKGWQWYYTYVFSLTFIHHLVFFIFDYFRWSALLTMVWISFTSALASVILIQIFRALTGKR
jgi:hypothetical protein